MGQSTEANLVSKPTKKKPCWFDPFLDCLKIAIGGNKTEILGVVLAPFIFREETNGSEFVDFSTEIFGKTTHDCITALDSNGTTCSALGKWDMSRIETFINVKCKARNLFFPACLNENKNRQILVKYYTQFLEQVQHDKGAIIQLNDALRQFISSKNWNIRPQDDLNPYVAAAKALYCAILVCACSVANFGNENPVEVLQTVLPERDFYSYPRKNDLMAHSEEISLFIQVVESYPASTMERFNAMTMLWDKRRNYYAGWELYQQYWMGDVLHNTAGTQAWQLVRDQDLAGTILQQLRRDDPSEAVAFRWNGNAPTYFPYRLEQSKAELQQRGTPTAGEIEALMNVQELSDEVKILCYAAYKAANKKPDIIYLQGLNRYRNAELWDLLADKEQIEQQELLAGAQCGSVKCLHLYLQRFFDNLRSTEVEDSVYELLLLANQKQDVSYIREIQDFYLNYLDELKNYELPVSDRHRDNIQLIGLGLHWICRTGEAKRQNHEMENNQKKLEEKLRELDNKTETSTERHTLIDFPALVSR